MDPREALIQLNQVRGLGSVTIHRLLSALGSAEAILGAPPSAWREILGRFATDEVMEAMRRAGQGEGLAEELERARKRDARIVTLLDADYPALLREIPDPPPVLYVRGMLLEEDGAAIAIVGTRAATPYGLSAARELAGELAQAGITVVSGLAEGIDAAGHAGALEGGGRTIAVVGHGLSTVYPARHVSMAERIAGSGAVISEFPMWMPPAAMNFPRRNRVIAGLSLGVVVVEAPPKSGALITAREAAEQGREVFGVPGPITSRASEGVNALLRDGAGVVTGAEDILHALASRLRYQVQKAEAVRPPMGSGRTAAAHPEPAAAHPEPAAAHPELAAAHPELAAAHPELAAAHPEPAAAHPEPVEGERQFAFLRLSEEESQVFGQIPAGNAATVDALAEVTELPPARLLPILTELEIKGMVRQMPGKGFTRSR